MKTIRLNAADWTTEDDFYDALLPALKAPDWHGRNLDALDDSIGGDDINGIRAPFAIVIEGAGALSEELREILRGFAEVVAEAAHVEQLQVSLRIEPPL